MNLAASLLLLVFTQFSPANTVVTGKPQITFDHLEHNFGTIKKGEKVTHVFSFTNTGDADLLIKNVKTTCGCTVGDYNKEPIKPGETDEIKVTFNSNGKHGRIGKLIDVHTNASIEPIILEIVAFVE